MAIVDKIRGEAIEGLRGIIDFYLFKGILPVARKYPKKLKPPYTELQAECMAAFSLANRSMRRLSNHIINAWKTSSVGKKASWTDVYRGIIMRYWKKTKEIAPIALNYELVENETEYTVKWDIMQLYLDPEVPEEYYQVETDVIMKTEVINVPEPIYYTLLDDEGYRLVAPYIHLEV